jgi:hypothetical protein
LILAPSSKCLFSSCFPIIFPVPSMLHEQVRHTRTHILKELVPSTKLFIWRLFYAVLFREHKSTDFYNIQALYDYKNKKIYNVTESFK